MDITRHQNHVIYRHAHRAMNITSLANNATWAGRNAYGQKAAKGNESRLTP
jgi:hypothetical protein